LNPAPSWIAIEISTSPSHGDVVDGGGVAAAAIKAKKELKGMSRKEQGRMREDR